MNPQIRAFLLGGLLPVIAYTVIEEVYGTFAGLIAGMLLGAVEILIEYAQQKSFKKVSAMTWGGNAMLFVLGAVSLIAKDGLWFKFQPALLELVFAVVLGVSCMIKKPLFVGMMKSQMQKTQRIPGAEAGQISVHFFEKIEKPLSAMTLRMAFFFLISAVLTAFVAVYSTTRVWALVKGVGFTVTLLLYGMAEALFLRYTVKRSLVSNRIIND